MFGKRKQQGNESQVDGSPLDAEAFTDDLDAEDRAYEDALLVAELDAAEAVEAAAPVIPPRPTGPWDVADAPEPEEGTNRLDLGGLIIPVPQGTEVRVDVSPEGAVVAATIVSGDSALQVNAFAAPKTAGIWNDVRTEIATALGQTGGQAVEAQGSFGTELHATVPNEIPDHGIVLAAARFVGVDGPRWFLRGLFTGPAATDPSVAPELELALRQVVVIRGQEAMAVRDALPLRLPVEAVEAAGLAGQDLPGQDDDPLQLAERGPEITEVR